MHLRLLPLALCLMPLAVPAQAPAPASNKIAIQITPFVYNDQTGSVGAKLADALRPTLSHSRYYSVLATAGGGENADGVDQILTGRIDNLTASPAEKGWVLLDFEGSFQVQDAGRAVMIHDGKFKCQIKKENRYLASRQATDSMYDPLVKDAVQKAAEEIAWKVTTSKYPLGFSTELEGGDIGLNYGEPFVKRGDVFLVNKTAGSGSEYCGCLTIASAAENRAVARILETDKAPKLRELLAGDKNGLILKKDACPDKIVGSPGGVKVEEVGAQAPNHRWFSRRPFR